MVPYALYTQYAQKRTDIYFIRHDTRKKRPVIDGAAGGLYTGAVRSAGGFPAAGIRPDSRTFEQPV